MIVAWADEALFQDFTTDVMAPGDQWKIHLGRRIYLSREDFDGSMFIEELIEEIIHCPRPDRWTTAKQTGTSVWVTKAVDFPRNEDGDDNDYEWDGSSWAPPAGSTGEEYERPWYEKDKYVDDAGVGTFAEDWMHDQEMEEQMNPLRYFDEYEPGNGDGEDEEEMEVVELALEEAMESDSDWSVKDQTAKEKERFRDEQKASWKDTQEALAEKSNTSERPALNAGRDVTMGDPGDEDQNSGQDDEETESDEPGSGWDSNDGIE